MAPISKEKARKIIKNEENFLTKVNFFFCFSIVILCWTALHGVSGWMVGKGHSAEVEFSKEQQLKRIVWIFFHHPFLLMSFVSVFVVFLELFILFFLFTAKTFFFVRRSCWVTHSTARWKRRREWVRFSWWAKKKKSETIVWNVLMSFSLFLCCYCCCFSSTIFYVRMRVSEST